MQIEMIELHTELNAFEVFTLFRDMKHISYLDSARDFKSLGRYSFIGLNKYLELCEKNGVCTLNDNPCTAGIFESLAELLEKYRIYKTYEIPFPAGCIGYVSYDAGLDIENIHSTSSEGFDIPKFHFIFYDNLIIFDNLTSKKYISACGFLSEPMESIDRIISAIKHADSSDDPIKQKKDTNSASSTIMGKIEAFSGFKSNFTREQYERTVAKMREYIQAGDIYIANLTQRFEKATDMSSFEIYERIREINPAPFGSYLACGDFDVLSFSPERFIRIENRMVETRPIKGTRPRGRNEEEDEANKKQLMESEKDKSELLMIVDLERNDLSKVCKPGTVKVTELFKLEEYSTVFHLVSTIKGELKDDATETQCIKACFPGGSITGTPKIRAMEIIDELEGIKRSLYTGCIGYFSLNGNADFNIVIRTLLKKGREVCFGVGGGITWESVESDEYEETLDKARVFFKLFSGKR